MNHPRRRLWISLAVLAAWIAITIVVGVVMPPHARGPGAALSQGVEPQFVAACVFLALLVMKAGWTDLGLRPVSLARSLSILWLPALYLIVFAGIATAIGLPPVGAIAFVLVNTVLVGISEELMFRGVLFSAFRGVLPTWPSIWLVTLVFALAHILNALITGNLAAAGIQAAAALFSGLLFIAIRLRTGSLYPAMALHAGWDFSIFLMGAAASDNGIADTATHPPIVLPVLFVLPLFLYAAYLLRRIANDPAEQAPGQPRDSR